MQRFGSKPSIIWQSSRPLDSRHESLALSFGLQQVYELFSVGILSIPLLLLKVFFFPTPCLPFASHPRIKVSLLFHELASRDTGLCRQAQKFGWVLAQPPTEPRAICQECSIKMRKAKTGLLPRTTLCKILKKQGICLRSSLDRWTETNNCVV